MAPQKTNEDAGLAKLACVECRRQHLKCDGKRPVCGRCTLTCEACHYQPSRRGRGRRSLAEHMRHGSPREPQVASISASMDASMDDGASTDRPSSATAVQPAHLPGPPQPATASIVALTPDATSESTTPSPVSANILPYTGPLASEPLPWASLPRKGGHVNQSRPLTLAGLATTNSVSRSVRLYYENFHIAHPILVPSSMYKERAYPAFLRLVIDFAGAHYSQSIPGQQQKEQVFAELTRNPDRSPCMVQAWLIYSIILFARGDIGEVHSSFTRGAEIAIEAGMNRADFASSRHPERSIEAESLRRTWWELVITEILISTSCSNVEFRCSKLPFEVTLPCEETSYTSNSQLPKPRTIFDFKRRILFDDGVGFSSYSYRIEATRILGRVLFLNRQREYHRDHFQSIENTLVSWTNHLPTAKLEIVNAHGHMDEMLFQAHTIITYAGMLLHLPRSNFSSIVSDMSEPYWSEASECFPSTPHMRLVQSIKATEASRRMSDYISLCPNLQKHSPFILPVLVLCGLAQLATSVSHSDDCFEHHYNRVTLALGCLKSMNGTWSSAESAYYRLRTHAAAMIGDSIDKCNSGNLPESGPMNQSTPGEFSRPMDRLDATTIGTEGQEILLPELDQCFIDEVCYNNTLFSSLLNFNHL